MNTVLIIDTETTGLDPNADQLIEVGAIIYSMEAHTSLVTYSSLVHRAFGGNAARAINGIPDAALPFGTPLDRIIDSLDKFTKRCDAICAHNAAFDRSFLPQIADTLPWICTRSDVQWPRGEQGASLVSTCLAHGLGVSHAHRALTDCTLLARLFDRVHEMGHDLSMVLERGLRPKGLFAAQVSYEDRELAKKAGFSWQKPYWIRTMARDDVSMLPFSVVELS